MMIKLERLQVEGFKRLSNIDLFFPPRCCVLIEGRNEAGKSTLFESIYFALYGDALIKRGRGRGQLESAICHGLSEAFIALTILIGDNVSLEIQRSLVRGRSNTAQLKIAYPDRDLETVSGIQSVNQRVIQELNGLDGEALLNSCFVEQKRLDKLEDSTKAKREEVLLKLLDMERLTSLGKAFKWGKGNDRDLDVARDKLQLVQSARKLAEAERQQDQIKRQLKLVAIHVNLNEIDQQLETIQEKSAEQEKQKAEAKRLDEQLACLNRLRSAETELRAFQGSLKTINEHEDEIRRLQDELDELDRLGREVLPSERTHLTTLEALQSQLNEIKDLEGAQRRARAEGEQLRRILLLARRMDEPQRNLDALPSKEDAALQATESAKHRLQIARSIEALQRWESAHRATEVLIDADEKIKNAQDQAKIIGERQETLEREQQSSKSIPVTVVLLLLGFVFGAMGFLLAPLWLIAAVLIVVGIIVGIHGWRQRQYIKFALADCGSQLQEYERAVEEQEQRKAIVTEQRPPDLETCISRLGELKVAIPESQEEAEITIATFEDELGEYDIDVLIHTLNESQGELSSLAGRREGLESEIARLQSELGNSLAEVNLPNIDAVQEQIEVLQRSEVTNRTALEDKWGGIAGELTQFDLSQEAEAALSQVAGQIGRLTSEIGRLEKQILGQSELKRQQNGRKERIIDEQGQIQEQHRKLSDLSEQVGDPVAVPDADTVPQVLADVKRALEQLDEKQLTHNLRSAQQAAASAQATVQQAKATIDIAKAAIEQDLIWLKLSMPDQLTAKSIADLEPEFSELSTTDQDKLETRRED